MLALVQAAFYCGIYAVLALLLVLPLLGMLAVTVIYILCDLLRRVWGRTYLP